MSFNEINAVENFVIMTMTGVNLNDTESVHEDSAPYGAQWKYMPSSELHREITEVMVETEVKNALIRLNPEIAAQPDRADEVIYKLRSILLSVNSTGLVRANEEFAKWLRGEMSMPFGKNYAHVPVRLIDFDHIANNSFWLVNQLSVRNRETKRPDVVLFVNGLPLVDPRRLREQCAGTLRAQRAQLRHRREEPFLWCRAHTVGVLGRLAAERRSRGSRVAWIGGRRRRTEATARPQDAARHTL